MKITFVLPPPVPFPIGGYKVAYEYANRLSRRNHKVTICHVLSLRNDRSLPLRIYDTIRHVRLSRQLRTAIPWFTFDHEVQLLAIPRATSRYLPKADATIATAWDTASWVAKCPREIRGEGFYLIQHVEDWEVGREVALSTWRLPLRKIVIAKWLQDIATDLGETSIYVPNGLDFNDFGCDISPTQRSDHSVAMLWHEQSWKGSALGLQALAQAHLEFPDLKAKLFSVYPRPKRLPDWIEYHRTPSRPLLRQIYNESAIFLTPSLAEGWALPPAEAMQCGCALVATAIGGHRDYAIDGDTAATFPPGDVEALGKALRTVLSNKALRVRIAESGRAWIDQYTWERAAASLEASITPQ